MPDPTPVQDKQEIAEVCYRYGIAIDNRDWATLATCFTPDANAFLGDLAPSQGYQAIEDACRSTVTPLTATQHLIGNVIVTLNGDTAQSVCYLQAQHVKAGTEGGEKFIFAGRYRDQFVRTGDGWKIRERRLEAMWTDGNPAVLGL
ncbi:MAG TPA: nuclear transport factor 2 family protein [Kribbellaceae bacterium]|jgi:ketosteroid isomerase-like protein